jgi:hypothetical protein
MQVGLSSCITEAPYQLMWSVEEISHYDYITTVLTNNLYVTCKKCLTLAELR